MSTKVIAWNNGNGNITLTYQGQGDGPITVESDENNLGTARSQTITIKTVNGVITKNVNISQAANPFPVGDVKTFSYTGSYQELLLPAGQYKLQCWGAQGGSNGTNSTYGITAKAGGKGGYSEGILTLTQNTTVRVYVGGQGSSSAGGYNGGGSTTGTSQYNSGGTLGYSKMGGGGGATDIRLSDGALLSRMIVAGGGAGGAMCYRKVTTTTKKYTKLIGTYTYSYGSTSGSGVKIYYTDRGSARDFIQEGVAYGKTYKLIATDSNVPGDSYHFTQRTSTGGYIKQDTSSNNLVTISAKDSRTAYLNLAIYIDGSQLSPFDVSIYEEETETVITEDTDYQVGGVGGGTNGGSYSSTYQGKQNAAGSGGSFGQGANQTTTGYRYCSAAGGGGWYGGGGGQKSDSSMTYCKYSGGGSGWVNIAANASNRPSGYTGLQLDSGETKDGATSFPNTTGTGNETGHSGNGYAKITRLA